MIPPRIAVIGAGHMGSALIGGLIAGGYSRERIFATCAHSQSATALQQRFNIQTSCDNKQAIAQADIVLFGVKPSVLPLVAKELAETIIQHNPLVISIAAGVMTDQLSQHFQASTAIIRAMPNTPVLIGHGASALYANHQTSTLQRQQAERIFASVGTTVWLDQEDYLYAVTALSGSGPAYFYLLMQALEEAAIELGLPASIAKPLIVQTALGSAYMAKQSADSTAKLCQQVASKGGGTEQALQVLESENFRLLMIKAVTAAEQRYRKLAGIVKEN